MSLNCLHDSRARLECVSGRLCELVIIAPAVVGCKRMFTAHSFQKPSGFVSREAVVVGVTEGGGRLELPTRRAPFVQPQGVFAEHPRAAVVRETGKALAQVAFSIGGASGTQRGRVAPQGSWTVV